MKGSHRRRRVWCKAPRPGRRPTRQSIAADHATRIMTLYQFTLIQVIFIICLQITSAKISGGPRGRFHSRNSHIHVSSHHAHYSYHPPSHINFMCRYCTNAAHYPVFHSAPPTYIYKFRESNSRYAVLLAGLSLYNLGRCCSQTHSHSNIYTPRSDEQCSLQVIDRRHYEETSIPCFMISSFMERSNNSKLQQASLKENANVNRTVQNEEPISFDISTAIIDVKPYVFKNDSQLLVSREQECVIWHNVTLNKEKHIVPCALLKEYAETMKPSGIPVYIWMPSLLTAIVLIYACCYCCCRKRRDMKEDIPLNQGGVYRYCSNYY